MLRRIWKASCRKKAEAIMSFRELLSGPRILLVDDEAEQLKIRSQVMKTCGFSVATANGPLEAISMMAEQPVGRIDLAVLDYHMPVMNGCALAERLKSRCPKLKAILLSGAIDIPQNEMTSVDVFIRKGDGIARLLAQIIQIAQVGKLPLQASRQTRNRPIKRARGNPGLHNP